MANGIKIISLYPEIYVAKDLQPLYPIEKYIEGLLLDEKVSYDGVNKFTSLTFLSVPDNDTDTVDLSFFSKLEMLACNLSNRLIGLETCNNLKSLTIGENLMTQQFSFLINLSKRPVKWSMDRYKQ